MNTSKPEGDAAVEDARGSAVEGGPGTSSLLDEVLLPPVEGEPPSAPSPVAGGILMGEIEAGEHPTLRGRARVALAGTDRRVWAPVLRGLAVRPGDRVLLAMPGNMLEPVVTGVLDGFPRRDEPHAAASARDVRQSLPRVVLGADEVVTITAADGRPLVELAASDTGPVVRLLHSDLDVEVPGRLRIRAASLELVARQGEVKVAASDDVVVTGENIHLN